jgi:hypothetical protein
MSTCIDPEWLAAHPEIFARPPLKRDRAHPYAPGTGPADQTCGTCAKCIKRTFTKNYYKCRVMMKFWTAGPGTDIRLKDRACKSWEPRTDKVDPISTVQRDRQTVTVRR